MVPEPPIRLLEASGGDRDHAEAVHSEVRRGRSATSSRLPRARPDAPRPPLPPVLEGGRRRRSGMFESSGEACRVIATALAVSLVIALVAIGLGTIAEWIMR